MSKHTEGTWNDEGFTVQLEDRTIIADCCVTNPISGSPPAKEYRANARLIAAAPELAEALKDCIERLEAYKSKGLAFPLTVEKARAALQKAGMVE